jgi:hypothetical protein
MHPLGAIYKYVYCAMQLTTRVWFMHTERVGCTGPIRRLISTAANYGRQFAGEGDTDDTRLSILHFANR